MVPIFYYGPMLVIIFAGVLVMGVIFYKIAMRNLLRRRERQNAGKYSRWTAGQTDNQQELIFPLTCR